MIMCAEQGEKRGAWPLKNKGRLVSPGESEEGYLAGLGYVPPDRVSDARRKCNQHILIQNSLCAKDHAMNFQGNKGDKITLRCNHQTCKKLR